MISYLYWIIILLIGYNQRFELMYTLHELIFKYIHYWDNDFRIDEIKCINRDDYYEITYSYKNGNKYTMFNKNSLNSPPYNSEQIIKSRHSRNMIKSEEDVIMAEYILNDEERVDCLDLFQELSGPVGNFHSDISGNILTKELLEKRYNIENLNRIEIMNSEGDIKIIK